MPQLSFGVPNAPCPSTLLCHVALRPVPAPVQMDFAPYFSVVSFTIWMHSS